MQKKLEYLLQEEGYFKWNSNLPEITVHFKIENGYVNLIYIINMGINAYIQKDIYQGIKDKISTHFKEKDMFDVHILSLIITKSPQNALPIFEGENFAWIVDAEQQVLWVPPEKAEDFYGMRSKIEECLTKPLPVMTETKEEPIPKKDSFYKKITVNYAIVAVNVFVFMLCTFTGELLYNIGTMSAESILKDGEWYRMIFSDYLHGGIDHLVSNMLFLYFLGNIVENKLGHAKYFILYTIAGLGGNFLSLAYSVMLNDPTGSIGASGAVFGVIGALAFLLIRNKGYLEEITLSRISFLIVYSLYSGFVGENIDNAAHIGGLITGFILCIILYRKPDQKENTAHFQ